MNLKNLELMHTIMTYLMTLAKQIIRLIYLRKSGGGYNGEKSIFDKMKKDDICIAFFPCTLFQENNDLHFRGQASQQKNMELSKKLEYVIKRHEALHLMYQRISQLVIVCIRKGIKLVIENPATQPHYLNRYWCIEPALLDKDRSESGDYYKKPTQYWFVGFEPKHNFIFEPIEYVETRIIEKVRGKNRQRERSMIHPQYARRFIKEHILSKEQLEVIKT